MSCLSGELSLADLDIAYVWFAWRFVVVCLGFADLGMPEWWQLGLALMRLSLTERSFDLVLSTT